MNAIRHVYDYQYVFLPDTRTKLISIQTLNQVIFGPHTKPSQL